MGIVEKIDDALAPWENARILNGIIAGNDDCNVWSEFGSPLVVKQHTREIPNIAVELRKIQKLVDSIGVASRFEVIDLEGGGQTLRIVNPRLIPFRDRLKYLLDESGGLRNRFSDTELEDYLIASMHQKIDVTMWCIQQNQLLPDADTPNWGIHPVNSSLLLLDFFGSKEIVDVKKLLSNFLNVPLIDYQHYAPEVGCNFCDGSPLDLLIRTIYSDLSLSAVLGLHTKLNNRVSRENLQHYRELSNYIINDLTPFPPKSTRQDRGEVILKRYL